MNAIAPKAGNAKTNPPILQDPSSCAPPRENVFGLILPLGRHSVKHTPGYGKRSYFVIGTPYFLVAPSNRDAELIP